MNETLPALLALGLSEASALSAAPSVALATVGEAVWHCTAVGEAEGSCVEVYKKEAVSRGEAVGAAVALPPNSPAALGVLPPNSAAQVELCSTLPEARAVLDKDGDEEALGEAEADSVPAAAKVAVAEAPAGEGEGVGVKARAVGEGRKEGVGSAVDSAVPVPQPAPAAPEEVLGQGEVLDEGVREGDAWGLREALGEGERLLVEGALREKEKSAVPEREKKALGEAEREGQGERVVRVLVLGVTETKAEALLDGLWDEEGLLSKGVLVGWRAESVGASTVAVAARARDAEEAGEEQG